MPPQTASFRHARRFFGPVRLVLLGLWVSSVAAAYFLGGENIREDRRAALASEAAGLAAADDARNALPQSDIARLIAGVRDALPPGMEDFEYTRDVLRALAPLSELTETQIQEALREVKRSVADAGQGGMLSTVLLSLWAETDGRAAITYALQGQDKWVAAYSPDVREVLGVWGRFDPDAAWRWFETEGVKNISLMSCDSVARPLFAGMASRDLEGTIPHLAKLGPITRIYAMLGIIGVSGQEARQRVLRAAEAQPEPLRAEIQRLLALEKQPPPVEENK